MLNTVLIVETTDQKEFMFRRNIFTPGGIIGLNSMLYYNMVIKKNINFVELNENTQLYLGWEIPIVDVKINDPIKSYSYWEFSEFGCLTYEVKEHNFDVNFLCKKLIV